MIKTISTAVISSFLILVMTACGTYDETSPQETSKSNSGIISASAAETGLQPTVKTESVSPASEGNEIELLINGSSFKAALEDNDTVKAVSELLPLTLDMSELNGNEKYCYLDTALPSAPEKIGHISAGDIMLYGDSCLVVFYESFDTSYKYTKIGHITDNGGLAAALGTGSIYVSFQTEKIVKTAYTARDVQNLQDFLLARPTEDDLIGKPYDLTGDDRWDIFDLRLMKLEIIQSHDI